jgi:preprotein translocase subunit SecG
METILLVAQCIVVVALVISVLLQPSSSDGMGALGGGGGHGLISSRATANILTKTTKWLAVFLMANSLGLAWLFSHNQTVSKNLFQQEAATPSAPVDGAAPAQVPEAPAAAPVESEAPSAPVAE